MKRFISKLGVALPIMMALAVMMPGTANATQAGAGAVVGTGTISPGLDPLVPAFQTFTFSGTAAGALASDSPLGVGVTCTINASGSSTIAETSVQGQGTGSATCTGLNLVTLGNQTVGCAFAYLRVGPIVVITGGCIGVFIFVPTSFGPTTSYALAGGTVLFN